MVGFARHIRVDMALSSRSPAQGHWPMRQRLAAPHLCGNVAREVYGLDQRGICFPLAFALANGQWLVAPLFWLSSRQNGATRDLLSLVSPIPTANG